eukprot:gb/GECG01010193.1/.p1 GENE.gb/GECG01010193.1/~~gb/GECG01010193.1/.p1  ORF type:complete len:137 (+),score=1.98 gb/GECG01010193.1/:1-411(+)
MVCRALDCGGASFACLLYSDGYSPQSLLTKEWISNLTVQHLDALRSFPLRRLGTSSSAGTRSHTFLLQANQWWWLRSACESPTHHTRQYTNTYVPWVMGPECVGSDHNQRGSPTADFHTWHRSKTIATDLFCSLIE